MDVEVDVEALREAVKEELDAAAFGGGFGGALIASFDADRAAPQELADMAQDLGIGLLQFEVERGKPLQ